MDNLVVIFNLINESFGLNIAIIGFAAAFLIWLGARAQSYINNKTRDGAMISKIPNIEKALIKIPAIEADIVRLDKKVDTQLARIETDIVRLDKKVDTQFARIETDIMRLDKKVDTQFARILDVVTAIATGKQALSQTNSPEMLSEHGRDVMARANASELVNNYYGKLTSLMQQKSLDNPYDIQQAAITVSFGLMDEINPTEQTALKNAAFQEGISLDYLLRAIGLMLRDRYFEAHQIPLTDINRSRMG